MHCWGLISFKCVLPQIWCPSATIPYFPLRSTSIFSVRSSISFHPKVKACAAVPEPTGPASSAQDEQEDFQVLTAIRSEHNDIFILDTPKSRLLLLDSTRMLSFHPLRLVSSFNTIMLNQISPNSFDIDTDNVHSIFNKEEKRTGSYWVRGDSFSLSPSLYFSPIYLLPVSF